MVKVSVIIPTYNRADTLPRAIDSVLDQTFDDFEILIVDDGSSDATSEIIKRYDDERIQYIYQDNSGANAARNRGVTESSGDLISFLDADDELLPKFLEMTVDTLDDLSDDYGGAFTSFQICKDGGFTTVSEAPERTVTYEDITRTNVVGSFSCTIFRSIVFEKVGFLDEDLPASQDYEFYLRLLDRYDLIGISEILVNYYASNESISTDIQNKLQAQTQIIKKYGEKLTCRRLSEYYYMNGFCYAENGQLDSASDEFMQAIKTFPYNPLYYYHYLASFLGLDFFSYSIKIKIMVGNAIYTLKNLWRGSL